MATSYWSNITKQSVAKPINGSVNPGLKELNARAAASVGGTPSTMNLASQRIGNTSAGNGLGVLVGNTSLGNNPFLADSEMADSWARGQGMSTNSSQLSKQSSLSPLALLSQNTTATPTYQTMGYDEAKLQALAQLNPQFDLLRSKNEQTFAEQRELTPQLLAAKGKLSGRANTNPTVQSATQGITQKEAIARDELETQREAAIASLATDIMTQTNSGNFNKWLQEQELNQKERQLAALSQYNQTIANLQSKDQDFNQQYKLTDLAYRYNQDEQAQSNKDREYASSLLKDIISYTGLIPEEDILGLLNLSKYFSDYAGQPTFDVQMKLNKAAGGSSSGGGGGYSGSGSPSSKASKDLANAIINDMQNEKLYLINNGGNPADFSKYMAQSITDAQAKGVWDSISDTDKARIFTLINNTANYDKGSLSDQY